MKKVLLPLIVLTLTLAFLLVSFMVYISKGENSYLLKKKLRIGALLLGLTFMANGCDKPYTTCYAPLPVVHENLFVLDSAKADTLTIKVKNNIVINGTINDRTQTEYSYAITDSNLNILQKENIYALDGAFDEPYEEFKIDISSLPAGKYYLLFYPVNKDQVTQNTPKQTFNLIITN